MAIIVNNISGKIMGFGEITILPGESKQIPIVYEHTPVLEFYKKNHMAIVTGEPTEKEKTPEEIEQEKLAAEKQAEQETEELRQKRLASLSNISAEDLHKLAEELGINPADCKDQPEILKKVKAALKK